MTLALPVIPPCFGVLEVGGTNNLVTWSNISIQSSSCPIFLPFIIKEVRVVWFAPVYRQGSAATASSNFPAAAAPLSLQTKDTLLNNRWGSNVACENQVDDYIAEVAWQSIMSYDRFGSSWNKQGGVMRVRSASYWGWNEEAAAKIINPTLILIGEQDGLLPGAVSLYGDLSGIRNKAIVRMECATHFAVWEDSQYKFIQEASLELLNEGTYRGNSIGEFKVGYGGEDIDWR